MTEAIMLEAIVKRLPELERLYLARGAASLAFTEVCKEAAQSARVDVAVLKAYIAARVDDKVEEKKEQAA